MVRSRLEELQRAKLGRVGRAAQPKRAAQVIAHAQQAAMLSSAVMKMQLAQIECCPAKVSWERSKMRKWNSYSLKSEATHKQYHC